MKERIKPTALRSDEAARYLGVARQTLAKWRSEGVGPPYCKVGGMVLYTFDDLDAFLAAHRRRSTSDQLPPAGGE